ncbi:MAG TPA: hypothetical protein GX693_04040 [Firmicutes bacterium]|nr:hypothetical protein [Bacillota bacterium]
MERRPGISKEYAALREQFELLKTELSKLISDRDYLLSTVKPDLEAKYYLRIGKEQYRLFLIRNEVLRMRRKVELIQACVNRGEGPDLKQIERDLDKELQKWREEVLELSRKIQQAELQEKLPRLSFEGTRELKKLYRELVRKLHPDINEYLPKNFKYLWERVLTAYQCGDLEELQTLSLLLSDQEIVTPELSTLEQLKADIKQLKEKINTLLEKLSKIQDDFPFNYQEKLEDEEWIEAQQEEIARQIKIFRSQEQAYSRLLENLLNPGKLLH